MPSFKCALKWPSVQRGAAAKAVVNFEKAFLAAAILAVAATERWQSSCGRTRRRVRGVCSRLRALAAVSLQVQPNGSSDRVARCWRLEGCDERAVRRAESYAAIISVREAFGWFASVLHDASSGCRSCSECLGTAVSQIVIDFETCDRSGASLFTPRLRAGRSHPWRTGAQHAVPSAARRRGRGQGSRTDARSHHWR